MKKFLNIKTAIFGILAIAAMLVTGAIFGAEAGATSFAIIGLAVPATNGRSATGMPSMAQPAVIQTQSANDAIVNGQGEINMVPTPQALTILHTSNNGGGGTSKTVYFLNTASLNAAVTDNGSGAASIVNTPGDGLSGAGYDQYARMNPIKCYGFTMHYITTSTGAENSAGLTTANPTWLMANLVGANYVPVGFVLNSGARNSQYLAGEMTVKQVFYLGPLNQLSYALPTGNTLNVTILCQPF